MHPFVPAMQIMRMYVATGGVEVYSTDGKTCMRDTVPTAFVRLIQEGMPPHIFIEEIEAAESEDDDDDDGDEDEIPTESPEQPVTVSNGQQTPTS
jgi:hypothetical protein